MRTTTPSNSSVVEKAWYNKTTKLLSVKFKNQKGYIYVGVPNAIFTKFQKAHSKGRFFTQNIRNVYLSQRDVFC